MSTKEQKSEAINIYKGKICIRKTDGSLEFVTDSQVSEIKTEIDDFIEKNKTVNRIKDIIFTVLKQHFDINKMFKPAEYSSLIPNDDPLYIELSQYILNNSTYSIRIKRQSELIVSRIEAAKSNKNKIHDEYVYEKSIQTRARKCKKRI